MSTHPGAMGAFGQQPGQFASYAAPPGVPSYTPPPVAGMPGGVVMGGAGGQMTSFVQGSRSVQEQFVPNQQMQVQQMQTASYIPPPVMPQVMSAAPMSYAAPPQSTRVPSYIPPPAMPAMQQQVVYQQPPQAVGQSLSYTPPPVHQVQYAPPVPRAQEVVMHQQGQYAQPSQQQVQYAAPVQYSAAPEQVQYAHAEQIHYAQPVQQHVQYAHAEQIQYAQPVQQHVQYAQAEQIQYVSAPAPVMQTIVQQAPASASVVQYAAAGPVVQYASAPESVMYAAAPGEAPTENIQVEDGAITIMPYFSINDMDNFFEVCNQCIEQVKFENQCLQFGYTIGASATGNMAFCREKFSTAEGVIAHLNNVDLLLKEGLCKYGELLSLQIHGPKGELDKLREDEMIKQMNPEFYELMPGSFTVETVPVAAAPAPPTTTTTTVIAGPAVQYAAPAVTYTSAPSYTAAPQYAAAATYAGAPVMQQQVVSAGVPAGGQQMMTVVSAGQQQQVVTRTVQAQGPPVGATMMYGAPMQATHFEPAQQGQYMQEPQVQYMQQQQQQVQQQQQMQMQMQQMRQVVQ